MKRYFIPRNSVFYSMIAHMQPRMRYLFSLALFLLVGCGWYFLMYCSIERMVTRQEKKLDCAQENVYSFCLATDKKETLSVSYAQMQQGIPTLQLNNKQENFTPFMRVLESISAAQMQLASYTVQQPQIENDYIRYHLHASIKGSSAHFLYWMRIIEMMHLPLSYGRCTLIFEQNGLLTGTVEMQCLLFAPKEILKDPPT